jgi:hypothetical protein
MRWACSTHEIDEKFIQNLIGKPKGKRRLGNPRPRWDDNIKVDLKVTELMDVDWINWIMMFNKEHSCSVKG